MCGICGIINLNNEPVSGSVIKDMMQKIKHRGPNDNGVFINGQVGLGFVRLSIIELTDAGHQPMLSQDSRYVIVFNGEIYNYIELRQELKSFGYNFRTKTDTEVLLTAWIHWGEACLQRFNGMWAFCIYDTLEKKIFAARDRFGVKPFYYSESNKCFAFASEIPPLILLKRTKPAPDYQTIFDYMVFNRTDQNENTFFSEIKKLQHGCMLEIDLGDSHYHNKPKIKKWYDLRERISKESGFYSPAEYKELLSSSIGLRLRSDVPVGVCLSGGLDSSSIVSLLIEDYKKYDINTFSAVYKKGQSGDESKFIDLYRSQIGNMHFTTPTADGLLNDLSDFVIAHAEPIPGTSPYAQFKVMQLAKKHVVVTLDGQGADEQLAGYHEFYGFFFKELLKKRDLMKMSKEILFYLFNHNSLYGIKSLLFFMLPEKARTRARVFQRSYIDPVFAERYQESNTISGSLYKAETLNESLINYFEHKLEHLLKWEDRNSMHFSIEARVPFLDYRLVEKTLATSGDLIIKSGMTKHILREAMKSILPEEIRLRRDKMGFGTPEAEWFNNRQWKTYIRDVFNSDSFINRKLVIPQKVKAMYEAHNSGKVNYSKEIWKLLHLELWFRTFID